MHRAIPHGTRADVSGRLVKRVHSSWLYGLASLPVLTDLIERGHWPDHPREWMTEVIAAVLVALLVRKIRSEHTALLTLARSDPLTGLGNRRAFVEALEDECVRAVRLRQPLCLVCIDLDHFKLVNDQRGHDAGDQVLRQLAAAMQHMARAHFDHGFRLGGDEFALILPCGTSELAEVVVSRLVEHCAAQDPLWRHGPLGMSTGIVEFDGKETAESLLQRADAAMYLVKRAHRSAAAAPVRPARVEPRRQLQGEPS